MTELQQLLETANVLSRIIDLRIAQQEGELPPPGEISQRQLAEALGLPRITLQRLEAVSLAKAAKELSQDPSLKKFFPTNPTDH
jgi:DNA-binding GntR family transcriptional regulator